MPACRGYVLDVNVNNQGGVNVRLDGEGALNSSARTFERLDTRPLITPQWREENPEEWNRLWQNPDECPVCHETPDMYDGQFFGLNPLVYSSIPAFTCRMWK